MSTGPDARVLEGSFRRFEELPARGAFDEKRELVRDIVAALARHSAGAEVHEHAAIDAAVARLQMLSPEATDHDEIVLELIDVARAHLADGHAHGGPDAGPIRGSTGAPVPSPPEPEPPDERVDHASDESFPASDPPSYTVDPQPGRS